MLLPSSCCCFRWLLHLFCLLRRMRRCIDSIGSGGLRCPAVASSALVLRGGGSVCLPRIPSVPWILRGFCVRGPAVGRRMCLMLRLLRPLTVVVATAVSGMPRGGGVVCCAVVVPPAVSCLLGLLLLAAVVGVVGVPLVGAAAAVVSPLTVAVPCTPVGPFAVDCCCDPEERSEEPGARHRRGRASASRSRAPAWARLQGSKG